MSMPAHRTARASQRSSRAAGRAGDAWVMRVVTPWNQRGMVGGTRAAFGGGDRMGPIRRSPPVIEGTIRRLSPFSKSRMKTTPTNNLPPFAAAVRARRADAQRNIERLIAAAREAFAAHGANAPLDDIARSAGVGAGTLYRPFPTPLAPVEAAYRDSVQRLCAEGGPPAATQPPASAPM